MPSWGRPEYRSLALVALPVAFVLGMIVTYRPTADGPFDSFARLTVFFAGAGLVTYGAARLSGVAAPVLPWLGLVTALATVTLLHATRVAHPVRRGIPFESMEWQFSQGAPDPRLWEANTDPPDGELTVGSGGLRLTARPGARAAIEIMPHAAWWVHAPASWLLPVGFDVGSFGERFEWRGSVTRTAPFFVVMETAGLLVQAVPSGLHLTIRGPRGSSAAELPTTLLDGGAERVWRLAWADGLTTLDVGDSRVWERAETERMGALRLGETRRDELHGGTLELNEVRYRRWWRPGSNRE